MSSISVDNSGNLTLNVNLSGSVTQSTDTFQTTITFRDQYDNIGSGTVLNNIAITKRFKFNINAGGAWAIKVNTLNYTITCGTRLLVGQ